MKINVDLLLEDDERLKIIEFVNKQEGLFDYIEQLLAAAFKLG